MELSPHLAYFILLQNDQIWRSKPPSLEIKNSQTKLSERDRFRFFSTSTIRKGFVCEPFHLLHPLTGARPAFFHIFLNLNNFHPKIFASFGDDFCPKIRDYVRIVTVFLLFSAPQAKILSFFRSAIQFRFGFPYF